MKAKVVQLSNGKFAVRTRWRWGWLFCSCNTGYEYRFNSEGFRDYCVLDSYEAAKTRVDSLNISYKLINDVKAKDFM